MIKSLSFFCLLIFLNHGFHSPDTFKIDLDLPPEERFRDVILSKKEEIKSFADIFLDTLPSVLLDNLKYLEPIVSQHQEFYHELLGVAKYANISFEEAFAFNLIYEILASCTSIVSIDKHGNIIHGRNLDYPYGEYISTFLVRLEFYRNGTLMYEGDGNAGFLGLVTGLKRNKFAISLNQRESDQNSNETFLSFVENKTLPIPYIIRNVLENANDYKTAVNKLSKEAFAANAYIIVSGINKKEGVVITRDRNKVYNISNINEENENWFLVQTNYDRDVQDPAYDSRRLPAEERIRNIGLENMDLDKLYNDVMSLFPNNNSITISSSVICAKTGEFNTTIWRD